MTQLMLLTFTALASSNSASLAHTTTHGSTTESTTQSRSDMTSPTASPVPTILSENVTITCYNAVKGQCSGNPLITASGRRIDLQKLDRGELRYVAVSRDLLKQYKYGDVIEVFITKGHPYNGQWTIADTMHKRWSKKIDLLLSTKQKLGKWKGTMTKI